MTTVTIDEQEIIPPTIAESMKAWRKFCNQRECPIITGDGKYGIVRITPYEDVLAGKRRPIEYRGALGGREHAR